MDTRSSAALEETRRLPRKSHVFEEVASITRGGKAYRFRASWEDYELETLDLATGETRTTTTWNKWTLLRALTRAHVDTVFIRQLTHFLSTWEPSALVGAMKEE